MAIYTPFTGDESPLTSRDTASYFSWAGRQNLMSRCCLLLTNYCAVSKPLYTY